jgi:hypothetical protein
MAAADVTDDPQRSRVEPADHPGFVEDVAWDVDELERFFEVTADSA